MSCGNSDTNINQQSRAEGAPCSIFLQAGQEVKSAENEVPKFASQEEHETESPKGRERADRRKESFREVQGKLYWVLRDIRFHSPFVLDKSYQVVQTSILENVDTLQIHSISAATKQELKDKRWVPKEWELNFSCQFSRYSLPDDLKMKVRTGWKGTTIVLEIGL